MTDGETEVPRQPATLSRSQNFLLLLLKGIPETDLASYTVHLILTLDCVSNSDSWFKVQGSYEPDLSFTNLVSASHFASYVLWELGQVTAPFWASILSFVICLTHVLSRLSKTACFKSWYFLCLINADFPPSPFLLLASLVVQTEKNLPTMQETWVQSLDQEDSLEKEEATQPSILAWRIPWSEEPGGLQSMGSQSRTLTEQLTFSLSNLLPFSPSPPSFPFPSLLFSSFVLHITNDECEEVEHRVLAQRKFISNQASVFTSVARKGGNTQMSFPVLKELIENQSYKQGRENPTRSMRYFQAFKKCYS